MNKVEMNLHFDEDQQSPSFKEISSLCKRGQFVVKDQPTRVKLAKKLRSISTKQPKEEHTLLSHPYDPFHTIPHQQTERSTRMTQRSSHQRKKLHHFHQAMDAPLLGLSTISRQTLRGEQELWCRGDPIKNHLRPSRKYQLVNEISKEVTFLQKF